MTEPAQVDVIVVGAGAAGMTAALAAESYGLEVLLVEATGQVGGTSATSAGTLWLPCADPRALAREGNDGRESARRYLEACIGKAADPRKIEALLTSGPELLRFLREATQVRLELVARHPDYLQAFAGATLGGRAFAPAPFDGRRLGRAFERVRPPLPEFMVLGGMMVAKADIAVLLNATRTPRDLLAAARLLIRHAGDRMGHARGTRLVMGNALVAQLYSSVRSSSARIAFDTRVAQASRIERGFECILRGPQGEQRLRARQGVVLASGGFSGDASMRERWLPAMARSHSVAHPGSDGSGIRLGLALGGAVEEGHASPAFWMPVSTMKRTDGSVATFPHIMLDRAKPGLLAVDATGHRFTNEAASYHHFCEDMLASHRRTGSERFFLIADAAFVKRYGLGLVRPGWRTLRRFVNAGYLVQANSPHHLAAQLHLEPDVLTGTLVRYNRLASSGADDDFHRGASALDRHNGDPFHGPNPCLRPLDLSALCAVQVHVADLGTSIGLSTDADACVLDAAGRPVPGLYACGNDMASMMRGVYPGPGATLGPGMTFAWRAARHIAQG